jgi:hypothetical protein
VQGQDLQLFSERAAEARRVAGGGVEADDDVAESRITAFGVAGMNPAPPLLDAGRKAPAVRPGKGKHVRRLVLVPVARVQAAHGRVAGEDERDLSRHAQRPARVFDHAPEARRRNAPAALLVE